ncbi:MAG: 2-isopropylmalate synthase [Nitrososphaerota archaeon]|jgi:D-citramalate synthase|nr:2-isopropylmalate synthase [Nitrososphaerota archaeon]
MGLVLLNRFSDCISFLDTTLRDGEQTPGVSLVPENKLRIAQRLDELGVNIIEAGFAAVSAGEFEAVRLIAGQGLRAEVASAGRSTVGDVDAVVKSGAQTMSMIIPTSDLHICEKLHKTRDQVLKITEDCVSYAKAHGLRVDLLAEDATRSDFEYLVKVFEVAVSCGVDRVTPCDTVGILSPDRAYAFFEKLTSRLEVPVGVHCHNEFGMAVANTVAALGAGAQVAHGTINGLGERAGNAAIEEVVVALCALYKQPLSIKTELLYSTSQLVSRLTGVYAQPNKAIVGENAFKHESGIHTQGMLSNPLTYEPFSPELVGRTRRISQGKHSGSHAIKADLDSMGISPSEAQLQEIFLRVKQLGDKGKTVLDADVLAIAENVMDLGGVKPIELQYMAFSGGVNVAAQASVRLCVNGKVVCGIADGVGPVDAAINAVKNAIKETEPIILEQYNVKAITGGTDAMVEVVVNMRKGLRVVTAMGVREDIVKASMDAVISGMNVLTTDYRSNGK